jgi:hypothetical protein
MIPITSITPNAGGGWSFTWPSQGASFYRIVLWGVELDTTTFTTWTYNGSEYGSFPPPLEIAYEDQEVLSEEFLPYLIIQWYGESQVSYYLVQQLISGTWQTITQVVESGQWVYSFQSPTLTDEQTYSYQVIAVDSVGNQSTPQQYVRYVVCPPLPPDGSISVGYGSGNIIIQAS